MNQTDDLLIQWIECGKRGVKLLDGPVLVSNAISLFEFLLQPGHQCAAASRTAPLARQDSSSNTERPESSLLIIAGEVMCSATDDEQGVAQKVGGLGRRGDSAGEVVQQVGRQAFSKCLHPVIGCAHQRIPSG
jgi:hypothetical protein